MSQGLATTLSVLTKTKNEAASAVLLPALDSARPDVQEGALIAILDRHSQPGQREIIRRLHTIDERWKTILAEHSAGITAVLRDAILSQEAQFCLNGCQASLWFREYDLIPALINAAEDEGHLERDLAARTVRELCELLHAELASPRDYKKRRDPRLVREHVVSSLEKSVARYGKHRRTEMLEAFLMLVSRDNCLLKQVLHDPHHASFVALVDLLAHSPKSGVIRLLLGFLDDPHAPSAGLNVVAHRADMRFIECLLRKIGFEPSAVAGQNIRRMESVAWLSGDAPLFDQMDDAQQHAAVQLAARSGISRENVLHLLEKMLFTGKPGGRRAAAQALSAFHGAHANGLALRALDDPDPLVQAAICRQLRPRGVPGAVLRLVELLESPHEPVMQAARQSLDEFTFQKFLVTFDVLDDRHRRVTGELVARVDPLAGQGLRDELTAQSRTRRLRGLSLACAMRMVAQVESEVIRLLVDDDYVVRSAAARALEHSETASAAVALREALADRSVVVQEAAEESLREIIARHSEFAADIAAKSAAEANMPQEQTDEHLA